MADLTTRYMGVDLDSPLVAAASPGSRTVDGCCALEEAGAAAIVMCSLFAESVTAVAAGEETDVYRSKSGNFIFGPEAYIEHLSRVVEAVDIPVIASLNVSRPGPWEDYVPAIAEVGVAAIELDVYKIVTDPGCDDALVLGTYIECLRRVKTRVDVPVALKLAPYFTSMAAAASAFDDAGADALVLFNRFYQPTIDIEHRTLSMSFDPSDSADSRLPMIWIAILTGQVHADLAASGGIGSAEDVIRMLMAGATVTQLCSAVLREGNGVFRKIRADLSRWLDRHECNGVKDVRGVMRMARHPGDRGYGREGYQQIINRHW